MMRSLYSGVSGLKNHQTRMDVIGNNISNVNTIGFKASRVVFQDIYSQTAKNSSAPGVNNGGTNPAQIGLGVSLAAIDVLHTSAATQRTDNPSDLAIEGDGFFVLEGANGIRYTRAGNFYIDSAGNLVAAGGEYVQGIVGQYIDVDTGFLPAGTDPTGILPDGVTVGDAANPGTIMLGDGTIGDANTYYYQIEDPDTPGTFIANVNRPYRIWYEPNPASYNYNNTYGLVDPTAITNINLKDFTSIEFDDKTGTIRGLDDNGERKLIGYLAIATFTNNSGLERVGSTQFVGTVNSGEALYTIPLTNGAGAINPGGLEMSNVDLSGEFTDMIITQRGFQANSRVITVSDTMLEELVNLKR